MYTKFVKRLMDIIISALGLIVFFFPMLIVAIIIYCEDPGPVIFKQKRVGIHKSFFNLYKFRSMKMDTPHNVPTHLLENPKQYILKSGGFFRKTSIDELPQLLNILRGDMSIIGPRPALWNQDDLVAERDKYGANDIKPGLTGLAQISGRDELEIPVKAKLDGEYTSLVNSGHGLSADIKCFFKTFSSVIRRDGVVEGGTGEINKEEELEKVE